MLYTFIITKTDGTIVTRNQTADTMKQAHQHSETLRTIETDNIKVYATIVDENGEINVDGLQSGALTIVKCTTANMICREGGDIQYRLYSECRKSHIDDPDVQDMLSVATLALLEAVNDGVPIDEQYHRAYLAVNKHLRASKQINLSATAMRTVYIEDINGDIISVNGEINRILAPDERYIPYIDNTDINDITNAKRRLIQEIISTLSTTQTTVLRYLAQGYSLRQIAVKINRTAPTVQFHINKIREKAKDIIAIVPKETFLKIVPKPIDKS